MDAWDRKYTAGMITFTVLTAAYLMLAKHGLVQVILNLVLAYVVARVLIRVVPGGKLPTFLGIKVDLLSSALAGSQVATALVLGAFPGAVICAVIAIVTGLSWPEDHSAVTP